MKFLRLQKAGYSIAELIVSIFIIALVTGIFLANYHANANDSNLLMSGHLLASDLRLAQSYSLGLANYNGQFPDGGWGVYFDNTAKNNTYIVFADINGDHEYNDGEGDPRYGGKVVVLPSGITINDTDIGPKAAITFLPPLPVTMISDMSGAQQQRVTIPLIRASDSSVRSVTVNFLGLIDMSE